MSSAKILDRLYLTAAGPAESKQFLTDKNITHILNLTGPDPGKNKPRHPNKYPNDYKYLHICKRDEGTTDIKEYIEKGHAFVSDALKEKDSNVVLVHCEAGISRSSTTVITYLMLHEGMRLRDAYNHVKKAKPNIGPNMSFFKQCIGLDKSMVGKKGGSYPDSKAITIEEYLAGQMLGSGGMLEPFSAKIKAEDIVGDLQANCCDIARTQTKFLNLALAGGE
uniref:protein-tyrosine-phosphatase n=1 Tax=Lotharella oceanica TaxID=641309 RepID=A0A7S2U2E4_9EUKA|mmetsp:Transcript_7234/g.14196  ORF Transcript_7234/g.14196 Transcript_7234/m.14196 type:complete len:222 (+) Transcript_7234:29-694(+)